MTTHHTAQVEGLEGSLPGSRRPWTAEAVAAGRVSRFLHQFRDPHSGARLTRFHVLSADYPRLREHGHAGPQARRLHLRSPRRDRRRPLAAVGFTGPMGMYMQDYGGPIGNRLIAKHPDWLQWQVIQNANSYEEGFTEAWDGIRHVLWANRNAETEAPLEAFLQHDTVKAIYTTGHPDPSKISPDNWNMDLFFLARPNAHRVQLDLFYDYRTNAALYPPVAEAAPYGPAQDPHLLGPGDIFFTPEGGEAYLRDLPDATMVRLNSGHFAVEDCLDDIASGIKNFYDTTVK